MCQRTVVRKTTVLKNMKLSNSTLHRRIREGIFPPPFYLGKRIAVWWQDEIEEVMDLYSTNPDLKELKKRIKRLVELRGSGYESN